MPFLWHCRCSLLPSSLKTPFIVCQLRASGQYHLRHTSDLPLSSAFHLYSPILSLSRATQTETSIPHLNFHWQEGTQKPLSNHRDWFTLKTRPGSKTQNSLSYILTSGPSFLQQKESRVSTLTTTEAQAVFFQGLGNIFQRRKLKNRIRPHLSFCFPVLL